MTTKNQDIFKSIFGLTLRLVGLAFICYGITYMPMLIPTIYLTMMNPTLGTALTFFGSSLYFFASIFIGIWFLKGAPWIMNIAYPDDSI
jgi:hypothetical protein